MDNNKRDALYPGYVVPGDQSKPAGAAVGQSVNLDEQQAHTISCMDSWAKTLGLPTYSEMRAAHLARQAQAEPVAWAYECLQPGGQDIWAEFISRAEPWADRWTRNIQPLYAAPVAPAGPQNAEAIRNAAEIADRYAQRYSGPASHVAAEIAEEIRALQSGTATSKTGGA